MEAFSLLKYWRTAGGATGETNTADSRAATKTIVTAPAAVSPYSDDEEDGPFFDLEFALPDQESDADQDPSEENGEKVEKSENGDEMESGSDGEEISLQDDDEERELKFALGGNDSADQHVAVSPSDELFFKGDLVAIEPSSILLNGSEENSKIPVFLLKSATKFRVLLLKLKKSKPGNGEKAEKPEKNEEGKENQGKVSGKLFAVKFKVEEVPIVSLFTRDSSSKESHGKGQKHNAEDSDTNASLEEKKLTKEVMQKYLKMVKPFYVRVSKRYVEKLKFTGHLNFPGGGSKGCASVSVPLERGEEPAAEPAAPSNVKTQSKQGNNLHAGLMVVRKRLGKSRSASAAAVAAPPSQTASSRRDDSLLQVQDGIQGAILHCKRSFNASRDGGSSPSSTSLPSSSSSILCRSVSDPSYEKSKANEAKERNKLD